MKRSLQYARTDRDIMDAVLRLIQEKPFEKITVQDILAEAMVNRSTFYQHYEDKYAVLEALQNKYISTTIDQLDAIMEQGRLDMPQIDQIMKNYFIKYKPALRALLHVKTEHVDIMAAWQLRYQEYLLHRYPSYTPLEAYMMAGLFTSFFIHYLENEEESSNYSSLFFQSFLHIVLKFFRIDQNPDASKELLQLLHKHAHY